MSTPSDKQMERILSGLEARYDRLLATATPEARAESAGNIFMQEAQQELMFRKSADWVQALGTGSRL